VRTRIALIRHAAIDGLGVRLIGRTPGVHLNANGRIQAVQLAERLRSIPLAAIYTSPRERAIETVAPLAEKARVTVAVDEQLDEIDFGRWTGKPFSELDRCPEWSLFNSRRSDAVIPEGESMAELSQRVSESLTRIARAHQGGSIAVISHADWIRAAAAFLLHLTLDQVRPLDVLPASIGVAVSENESWLLTRWNDTGSLEDLL
jgi:broad specificity phosphatase PhoE